MFDCLLLMAGKGTRTSLKYNKIMYKINNKPLFMYSLEKFLSVKELNKVYLVCKKDEMDYFKYLENEKIEVIEGGDTRFRSVLNGCMKATEDIVLIHDAARPNITIDEIVNVYNEAKLSKSACLGVKVKDCIREIDRKSKTLERSKLYIIQTPQGVDRKLLIEGVKSNRFDNYYDDCEVLEKNFDIECKIVNGSYNNIKVTTDDDIKYM